MARKTALDLQRMKADNPGSRGSDGPEKIAMVTAYDHAMARLVDQAGVDMVLVGDSLGMVIQGLPDTLSVTLEGGSWGPGIWWKSPVRTRQGSLLAACHMATMRSKLLSDSIEISSTITMSY